MNVDVPDVSDLVLVLERDGVAVTRAETEAVIDEVGDLREANENNNNDENNENDNNELLRCSVGLLETWQLLGGNATVRKVLAAVPGASEEARQRIRDWLALTLGTRFALTRELDRLVEFLDAPVPLVDGSPAEGGMTWSWETGFTADYAWRVSLDCDERLVEEYELYSWTALTGGLPTCGTLVVCGSLGIPETPEGEGDLVMRLYKNVALELHLGHGHVQFKSHVGLGSIEAFFADLLPAATAISPEISDIDSVMSMLKQPTKTNVMPPAMNKVLDKLLSQLNVTLEDVQSGRAGDAMFASDPVSATGWSASKELFDILTNQEVPADAASAAPGASSAAIPAVAADDSGDNVSEAGSDSGDSVTESDMEESDSDSGDSVTESDMEESDSDSGDSVTESDMEESDSDSGDSVSASDMEESESDAEYTVDFEAEDEAKSPARHIKDYAARKFWLHKLSREQATVSIPNLVTALKRHVVSTDSCDKDLVRHVVHYVIAAPGAKNISVHDLDRFVQRFGPFESSIARCASALFDVETKLPREWYWGTVKPAVDVVGTTTLADGVFALSLGASEDDAFLELHVREASGWRVVIVRNDGGRFGIDAPDWQSAVQRRTRDADSLGEAESESGSFDSLPALLNALSSAGCIDMHAREPALESLVYKRAVQADKDTRGVRHQVLVQVDRLQDVLAKYFSQGGHPADRYSVYWFRLCDNVRKLAQELETSLPGNGEQLESELSNLSRTLTGAADKWTHVLDGKVAALEYESPDMQRQNSALDEAEDAVYRAAAVVNGVQQPDLKEIDHVREQKSTDPREDPAHLLARRLFIFRMFGIDGCAALSHEELGRALAVYLRLEYGQTQVCETVMLKLVDLLVGREMHTGKVMREQWTHFMWRFGPLPACYDNAVAVCEIQTAQAASEGEAHVQLAYWFRLWSREKTAAMLQAHMKAQRASEPGTEPDSHHGHPFTLFYIRHGKSSSHVFTISIANPANGRVKHTRILRAMSPNSPETDVGGEPGRGLLLDSEDQVVLPNVEEVLSEVVRVFQWSHLAGRLADARMKWRKYALKVSDEQSERQSPAHQLLDLDQHFGGFVHKLTSRELIPERDLKVPKQTVTQKIRELLSSSDPADFVGFCSDAALQSDGCHLALSSFRQGMIVHQVLEKAVSDARWIEAVHAVASVFMVNGKLSDVGEALFRKPSVLTRSTPAQAMVQLSVKAMRKRVPKWSARVDEAQWAKAPETQLFAELVGVFEQLGLLENKRAMLVQAVSFLHVSAFEIVLDLCTSPQQLVDKASGDNLFHTVASLSGAESQCNVDKYATFFCRKLYWHRWKPKRTPQQSSASAALECARAAERWRELVNKTNKDGLTPPMVAAKHKLRRLVMLFVTDCQANFAVLDCNDQSLFNHVLADLDGWLSDRPEDYLYALVNGKCFGDTVNHRDSKNNSPLFAVLLRLRQMEKGGTNEDRAEPGFDSASRIRALERFVPLLLRAGAKLSSLAGHDETEKLKTDFVNKLVSEIAEGHDDRDRWLVLQSAVVNRDTELVRGLLASNELPYFFYRSGDSDSDDDHHDAAADDDDDDERKMGTEEEEDYGFERERDPEGLRPLQSVLHCAVKLRDQDPELVELLLTHNPDESVITKTAMRAELLMRRDEVSRSEWSDHLYRTEWLQPNSGAIDRRGRTALHVVAQQSEPTAGTMKIARKLIARVNVLAKDWRGFTALHYAAENGNLDLVRALLDAHADPMAKTVDPGDVASYTEAEPHLSTEERMWVQQHTVDVVKGQTALHLAAKRGHWQIVAQLLRDAAPDANDGVERVDPIDKQGHTPLCLALERHRALVRLKTLKREGKSLDAWEEASSVEAQLLEQLRSMKGHVNHHTVIEARGGQLAALRLKSVATLLEQFDATVTKLLAKGASIETAPLSAGLELDELIDVKSRWKDISSTIVKEKKVIQREQKRGLRSSLHTQKVEDVFSNGQNQIVINWRFNSTFSKMRTRFVAYMIFVLCVTWLAVHETTRNEMGAHFMYEGLGQSLGVDALHSVGDVAAFYAWMSGPMLDALYSGSGYTGNSRLRLVGTPRLRQLRAAFGHGGEGPDVSVASFGDGKWTYATEEELGGATTWGRAAWYEGGGFVVEMPPPAVTNSREAAGRLIRKLEQDDFIDVNTRAVFVEFAAYDPHENFLAVCNTMLELPSSGAVIPSAMFNVVPLRRGGGWFESLVELLVSAFVLLHFVDWLAWATQHYRDSQEKPMLWSLTMRVTLLVLIGVRSYRAYLLGGVDWDEQTQFVPLQQLGRVAVFESLVWSVLVLAAWFHALDYVKIFRPLGRLLITISFMLDDLRDFAILMVLVLGGFASAEYVAYGYADRTAPRLEFTLLARFSQAFSGREIDGRTDLDRGLGVVYPIMFVVVVSLLMMNLLVAILSSAYDRARTRAGKSEWASWQYKVIEREEQLDSRRLSLRRLCSLVTGGEPAAAAAATTAETKKTQ